MALKLSTAARNALLDSLTTSLGNGALLRIYTATRPATANTGISGQSLLAELVLGSPAAGPASGGVLTLNAITTDSSADATGTASWFRVVRSDGTTPVFDGDCVASPSTGDLVLNTTSIVATGPVSITSFSITAPGA